jgi:hypothetical protein
VRLSYCDSLGARYHVFVLTDLNFFDPSEIPAYTRAGCIWYALDLYVGAEEIYETAEAAPLDDEDLDIIARFETRAAELLSL